MTGELVVVLVGLDWSRLLEVSFRGSWWALQGGLGEAEILLTWQVPLAVTPV